MLLLYGVPNDEVKQRIDTALASIGVPQEMSVA